MKTFLIYLELGPLASILLNQQIEPYLRSMGTWAKLSSTLWLIKSSDTAAQIRDNLRGFLSNLGGTASDRVIVVNVTNSEWASYNLSTEIVNWMKDNI